MENDVQIQAKKPFYKKVIRVFLWAVFTVIFIIGAGIGLVFIYEDEVKAVIIKELNKHLATEVRIDPKNIDLTFISSFPKCAIEFKDLTAMEAWNKKQKDTLLFAEKLSLKFSLKDLFEKKYDIKQISLLNARCYLKADKDGKPNYEVWKTGKSATSSQKSDSLQFKLEDITLKNVRISYKNRQQKFKTDCTINDVVFAGNFSENEYEMSSKGTVQLNSMSMDKSSLVKNKELNLDIVFLVTGNKYTVKKANLGLNKMEFDLEGDFRYSDSLENFKLNYKATNMDIESVLSLLPEKYKERINDYKSTGEFFANGNFSYDSQKPLSLSSSFGIKKATIEYSPKNSRLSNVVVNGELILNGKTSYLKLNEFNADLGTDNVKGRFFMENFGDPLIEVAAEGSFDLQNLQAFWPIDTLEKLEGSLKFNGEVKGKLSDIRQNTFSDKLSVIMNLEVAKLRTQFKNDPKEIAIESCKIIAVERDIKVEDFKLLKGETDIELRGEIPGMFNYLLDNKSQLIIHGTLTSKNLAMEDLIFPSSGSKGSSSTSSGFSVPDNVNLVLDADIHHLTFGKFEASSIHGNFELKNQKAMVSDMKFETMEGEAEVNALADASGDALEVNLQAQLKNLNVKKMFTQLNNFGQATLMDKNINGYVTATIDFSGSWDKQLNPKLNSIVSSAEFTIDRGELIDFKPLEGLARFVDLQELKRIKFASLTSSLQIKNSTIYIPQTSIKNSALNIDFSGTHTFNNDVDYHIRLLINELLAKKRKSDDEFGPVENDPDNRRSAFILMTGNIDKLIFKYDRKGLKQKIKEDIKTEKQNLKQLLRDEFSSKKDTSKVKPGVKADQKFELEKPGNKTSKKALEEKKKKDDDDDF